MTAIAVKLISDKRKLYAWASALALITIFYNIAEGLVSVLFGFADESMSLFSFGLDSFVEVVSGIGILHMIRRIKQEDAEKPDRFEQHALLITGTAFFVLTAELILTSLVEMYRGHKPENTFWGIVISIISILSMGLLLRAKGKVGRALDSSAILADAACSRACFQLSIVLLIASAGYKLTGIGGLDSIGAFVIGGFCYREGKEAFAKARVGSFTSSCEEGCPSHGRKKS
jgi:divalent metal cation (Fe/Co/Zn/Cd) transporter